MKIRGKPSEIAFDIFNYALNILFILICLYPFYYVLIYSLSGAKAAMLGVYFWPVQFTLSNFVTVFRLKGLPLAALISVARTVIGASLTVMCCALFGYVLTKEKMPGRKFFYRMTVATMYISAGLIPWYLTMRAYGLANTFWIYVIPSAVSAYYVVLMKTFMEQLPASLEESARIDGAGYPQIFYRIILPLSMPIMATILVFAAVGQWNSYFDNYIFVTNTHLTTLQLILFQYMQKATSVANDINQIKLKGQAAQNISPTAVKMTVTMVVTFPILFVYPFAQRYFVKGIMIGAIKG